MGGTFPLAREETMPLMERAKNILFQPKQEWPVIGAERATTGGLYTSYIIPLAAIWPAASLIGWSVLGARVQYVGRIRVPFGEGLKTALITYLCLLAATYALALSIDALAPTFGGQKNQIQAMKVAAYSLTAAWVAGIFSLFPGLGILGLLASLYSLYLLFLGLSLMKAPEDQALGYTVVVCVVAIVLAIIVQYITRQFTWQPAAMGIPNM